MAVGDGRGEIQARDPQGRHADAGKEVTGLATAFDNWRYWNSIKSANVTIDRGVAEEAVMRTIPFVLIAFVALSLPTSVARAEANGGWCANYGTGHSGVNCSYASQQQCLASVSGVYGFCTPNPYPGTGYGRGGSWNLPPSGPARGYPAGQLRSAAAPPPPI